MMKTPPKNVLAYRYRLYPTKAQVSTLNETLATCRLVYNSLVHERTVTYAVTGKSPSYLAQKRAITSWKPNHAELSGVHSQVLQNVCSRVELAFAAFFRRIKAGEEDPGYPRQKGKGQYDSITYPGSGFGFYQGRLRLSKIGDLAIRLHRPVEGTVAPITLKTCTVRKTKTGKWFVCFSCEVEPKHLEPSDAEVGIDVGIKFFVALSNGEFIANPRFFRKEEEALAKAQRRFDKVKHEHKTKARPTAKKVVAHIHERVKCRRHDFVHQTARRLVNRFGVIAVESLQIENMMATPKPKPDPENPGQFLPNGAAAKAGLNKSIADVSWSMFRTILTMKAESAGRKVVAVNPAFTSQTCSGCGDIVKKTLNERVHRCLVCGLVADRDTNAAINISTLGQQSLATRVA